MKRKIATGGIIAVLIVLIVLIASTATFYILNKDTEKLASTPTMTITIFEQSGEMKPKFALKTGSFTEYYTNVNELADNAEIIVRGNVKETSFFDFNTITFTKSKVRVTKCYKGDVKPGEIITYIETGGITTKGNLQKYNDGKGQLPEDEYDDLVEISFNGSKTSRKMDHVLLFAANDNNFYQLNEITYGTIGEYQGKFNINGNEIVKRYSETNSDTETLEMTMPEMEKQLKDSTTK